MRLIVGLGNPGNEYTLTRHNAGFLAIDQITTDYGLRIADWKNNFHSLVLQNTINDQKTFFVKPQTFMNLSGTAVAEIVNFYKVDAKKDLLVIHDDIDLPFGILRSTQASSAAGHNGVKNIIENLGTQEFMRIRIGIESRKLRSDMPTEAFVLQKFSSDELTQLKDKVFPEIKNQINNFINF